MSTAEPNDEILEFAIAREIEANRFYMALAKRVESPEMRKVLIAFAQEELVHKAKLELEVMKIGKVVPEFEKVTVPENADAASEFDPVTDMDFKELLLLAIKKEDAAFRTYISLLNLTKDEESREMLLGIAEEEVKHKLRFQIEYDMLLKKSPR